MCQTLAAAGGISTGNKSLTASREASEAPKEGDEVMSENENELKKPALQVKKEEGEDSSAAATPAPAEGEKMDEGGEGEKEATAEGGEGEKKKGERPHYKVSMSRQDYGSILIAFQFNIADGGFTELHTLWLNEERAAKDGQEFEVR